MGQVARHVSAVDQLCDSLRPWLHFQLHLKWCLPSYPPQTEEALHALRCYVDHLCGSLLPQLLQGGGRLEQASPAAPALPAELFLRPLLPRAVPATSCHSMRCAPLPVHVLLAAACLPPAAISAQGMLMSRSTAHQNHTHRATDCYPLFLPCRKWRRSCKCWPGWGWSSGAGGEPCWTRTCPPCWPWSTG